MNKSFIFDWSGTLSDNFHCFSKACALMFIELGKKPISDEEIRLNYDAPYMKFWNRYFPKLSMEEEKKLYKKYICRVGEPDLYPGVVEMINLIYNSGWKIIVLSADPISTLMLQAKKSSLFHLFEKVIGEVHDKEDTIKSLVVEFNLDPKSTYYVGDTSGDAEVGRSAGVKTIVITWGFQDKKILSRSKPGILIDDIKEMKGLLANL